MKAAMQLATWASVALVAVACHKAEESTPTPSAHVPAAAAAAAVSSVETRWVTVVSAGDAVILEAPAWTVAAPGSTAEVTVPVRGRLEEVLVRAGDHVDAGQALVRLRSPELVSAVVARKSAQKRIDAWEKHVRELANLRKDGLARTADVFAAEAQLADLQAERAQADAVLHGAGLTDADAATVEKSGLWTLRAPMAGVVRDVAAVLGAQAEPGAAPLLVLVALQPARVEVHLHQPLPADVRLRFEPTAGTPLELADAQTATAVDPQDGSIVRWFAPATPADLPAGLRGRLRVSSQAAGALQVPARALVQRPEGAAVVKKQGQSAVFAPVTVLAVVGPLAIVRGLQPGDAVAAESDRSPLARPPEGGD